jgi:hypothetical protein
MDTVMATMRKIPNWVSTNLKRKFVPRHKHLTMLYNSVIKLLDQVSSTFPNLKTRPFEPPANHFLSCMTRNLLKFVSFVSKIVENHVWYLI